MGFDFLTFSNPSKQLPSPLAEAKRLGGDLRQGCGLAGGKVRIPKNLRALCGLGWEPDCVILGREKRGCRTWGRYLLASAVAAAGSHGLPAFGLEPGRMQRDAYEPVTCRQNPGVSNLQLGACGVCGGERLPPPISLPTKNARKRTRGNANRSDRGGMGEMPRSPRVLRA